MKVAEINSLNNWELKVDIHFSSQFHRRLWIATKLIKLAARILQCDIKLDWDEFEDKPKAEG